METTKSNSRPKIHKGRSSSSNSESLFQSPLRFESPLRSDQGDPPETPPYSSTIASENSTPVVAAATHKFIRYPPSLWPIPPDNLAVPPEMMLMKVGTASVVRRSGKEAKMRIGELGFRVSEIIMCLISFSVMAADKTQGWSGDSFDRYKEYRFCLAVNVIGCVYAGFQAYDLSYQLATGKQHLIRHHLRHHFNFFMDQMLAYLLASASSSAGTRVDDWQSNWGKDKFTEMATASVFMAFLAFIAYAGSSIISGYNLYNRDAI